MAPLPAPHKVERIAVRLTNWVGDCVMNTPFLAQVRRIFPGATILCLGRSNVTALLQHHPAVDELWTIDDHSRTGFIADAAKLRRWRPQLGFLLPNSLKTAAFFSLARVPVRVGYDRDARRVLLTHPVPLRPEDLGVHEVDYYQRLLHGWCTSKLPYAPLHLAVLAEEQSAMVKHLAEAGIGSDDFVVGVNPAAFFGTAKRWDTARYAEAASHFVRTRGARVVVTGLAAERDVAQAVCDAGGPAFVNMAGRMKLRELMAFLRRANLFLTNDSGAMHIAAAFHTPLVAIFGSTDWVTTAPASPNARIVRVETPCAPCLLRHCPIDHRCMTGVTPQMVVETAEELLAAMGTPRLV